MLEHQRRQYDEIMTTSKNDASAKMQALRQEGDFNMKMAQRSFNAQQNELIREYEKKLADQKVEHDKTLDEIKSSAERTVREAGRQARVDSEAQARANEQKLAQIEMQHKERERYVTQNYQDDLEKMKRSNALLIQKKS